jgi:hypothetical protein
MSEADDFWNTFFEADDLVAQVAVLRELVRTAAGKDPVALQLLPAVDRLLAEVQVVLGQRN